MHPFWSVVGPRIRKENTMCAVFTILYMELNHQVGDCPLVSRLPRSATKTIVTIYGQLSLFSIHFPFPPPWLHKPPTLLALLRPPFSRTLVTSKWSDYLSCHDGQSVRRKGSDGTRRAIDHTGFSTQRAQDGKREKNWHRSIESGGKRKIISLLRSLSLYRVRSLCTESTWVYIALLGHPV